MNEVAKNTTALTQIDSYDFCDDKAPSTGGAEYAKFDSAAQHMWHGREAGAGIHLGPYYAPESLKELLKWNGKRVVDRIPQKPGEPFPDVVKLNDLVDIKDWEEDFNGNAVGPWKEHYTVFLVNPKDGSKVICRNSTFGQKAAFDDLKEKTRFMRKLRGEPGGEVAPLTAADIVQDEIPDCTPPKAMKAKAAKKDFKRPASMPEDPDDGIPAWE